MVCAPRQIETKINLNKLSCLSLNLDTTSDFFSVMREEVDVPRLLSDQYHDRREKRMSRREALQVPVSRLLFKAFLTTPSFSWGGVVFETDFLK